MKSTLSVLGNKKTINTEETKKEKSDRNFV